MMWKLSGQGSDMIGAKYFTHLYSAVKSFQMVCLVERCPNQDCSWDTLWLSNMAMSNLANPPMSVDEFAIDAPFFIIFSDVQSPSWYLHSMDWFKGHFTGKPHDLHGKIPLVSGSQIFPIQPIHWSMDGFSIDGRLWRTPRLWVNHCRVATSVFESPEPRWVTLW